MDDEQATSRRPPTIEAPRPMRLAPWKYALLYLLLSLGTEIVLLVVFRLRIPQDNRILGPLVLSVPPLAVSWIAGYRRPGPWLGVALLTAAWTLCCTILVTRITGKSVGLPEPVVSRSLAGLMAALSLRIGARRRCEP